MTDIEEVFHGKPYRRREGEIVPVNVMLLRTRFTEIFDFKKSELGFIRYEKSQQGELKATYTIFDQEGKWLGEVDFSPIDADQTIVTYEFDSVNSDLFNKIETRLNSSISYYKGFDKLKNQSDDKAMQSGRKIEKVKSKGRYRLTPEEIKFRRGKVKEANKEKKQNPLKRWDEIDFEFSERLKIPKDSFRRWRHNNY